MANGNGTKFPGHKQSTWKKNEEKVCSRLSNFEAGRKKVKA